VILPNLVIIIELCAKLSFFVDSLAVLLGRKFATHAPWKDACGVVVSRVTAELGLGRPFGLRYAPLMPLAIRTRRSSAPPFARRAAPLYRLSSSSTVSMAM